MGKYDVTLADQLRLEAQNNQMIDQHYLYAGTLMMKAADNLDAANEQIAMLTTANAEVAKINADLNERCAGLPKRWVSGELYDELLAELHYHVGCDPECEKNRHL